MNPDLQVALDTLDRAIGEATPEQVSDLMAALAARIATLAARGMNRQRIPQSELSDENVDVRIAAARLGVSTAFLYKNASRLPFTVRIGRCLRFSSRGLEYWNRQRRGR